MVTQPLYSDKLPTLRHEVGAECGPIEVCKSDFQFDGQYMEHLPPVIASLLKDFMGFTLL